MFSNILYQRFPKSISMCLGVLQDWQHVVQETVLCTLWASMAEWSKARAYGSQRLSPPISGVILVWATLSVNLSKVSSFLQAIRFPPPFRNWLSQNKWKILGVLWDNHTFRSCSFLHSNIQIDSIAQKTNLLHHFDVFGDYTEAFSYMMQQSKCFFTNAKHHKNKPFHRWKFACLTNCQFSKVFTLLMGFWFGHLQVSLCSWKKKQSTFCTM